MSTAYWSQCSHAELMSMQGVELDEIDIDLDQNEYDTDLSQKEEQGCCSRCMDCLGLSWRDFL